MKKQFSVLAIALIAIAPKALIAQSDICGCNIALEKNTQDQFEATTSSSFIQALSTVFSQSFDFWDSGEWKKDQRIASGGSYAVYSGFFDGSQSTEEKRKRFEEMKTFYTSNKNISLSDYKFYSQKIASGKAYESWLDCKKICINEDLVLLDKTVSGNEIIVNLFWKHRNTTDQKRVLSIVTSNATQLEGGNLGKDTMIAGQNTYTGRFRRDIPTQDASIKINVSEYPTDPIIIPGIEIESPASNYPIGTIIASVLDWKRFCKVNNQSDVLDYSNKVKCKWAPADGRSVVGSMYGTIENKVPDLRGVFLRGINEYGVPSSEVTVLQDNQKNPEDTKAGGFQEDNIRAHSHQITVVRDPRLGYRNGISGAGYNTGNEYTEATISNNLSYSFSTLPSGSQETRPKNVTVYYYIKIN